MGGKKSGLINWVAVLKGSLNKNNKGPFEQGSNKVGFYCGRNRKTISKPETRFSIVSPQDVSC